MALGVAIRSEFSASSVPLMYAILEGTDLGILLTDLQHRSLVCNERFGEIFGVDPKEAVNCSVEELRDMVKPIIKDVQGWLANLSHVYAEPALRYQDQLELKTKEHTHVKRFTGPVFDQKGRII